MNSLLQKFLTDAESAGLSEGDYLTVANALKEVFKKVEEPTEILPRNTKVEGYASNEKIFTLRIISRQVTASDSYRNIVVIELKNNPAVSKRLSAFNTTHLLCALVEEYHVTELKFESTRLKINLSYTSSEESLLEEISSLSEDDRLTSNFSDFISHTESIFSEFV